MSFFWSGGQGVTGSRYITQAGLEPKLLLPQSSDDPSALDSRVKPRFRSHQRLHLSHGRFVSSTEISRHRFFFFFSLKETTSLLLVIVGSVFNA